MKKSFKLFLAAAFLVTEFFVVALPLMITSAKADPEHLDRLESVQFSIIRDYSSLLKTGGIMVYATCSILPKENRLQVDAFLAHPAGAQFELLEDRTVDPSHDNDGFYMARLRKLA